MMLLIGETSGNPHDERRLIKEFYRRGVDGLILVSPRLDIAEIDSLSRRYRPIVTVFSLTGKSAAHFASIELDNRAGAREAVKILVDRGHQHIAYLAGRPFSASNQSRRAGYEEALTSIGSIASGQMIVEMSSEDWPTFRAGYDQCRQLLALNLDIDAIFAYNDIMAIGAMKAMREQGKRIPDDISIVGYDNTELCEYSVPPLSSVGVELPVIAARVVDLLKQMIDKGYDPTYEHHQVIMPRFVPRQSVTTRTSS